MKWIDTVYAGGHFNTQRKNIKNTAAGTNRGFAVLERIPNNPDSRFKIQLRWIPNVGTSQKWHGRRVLQHAQIRELAIHLRDDGGHFIPQTPVDGQVRTDMEVILKICAENVLPNSTRSDRTWSISLKQSWRSIAEKIRQGIVSEGATG